MFELLCGNDLMDAKNVQINKECKAAWSSNLGQVQNKSRPDFFGCNLVSTEGKTRTQVATKTYVATEIDVATEHLGRDKNNSFK